MFFYPILSSEFIFSERDLAIFFIPPRYLWVEMVKSFELPLWNPYNYSGIPLLATLQPGILYPPNFLFFLLPFNIAWNWLIILHFVFSGFNVYVFLRYFKSSWEASFAGAITFMLSGYLLSVHNVLPHLFSVSWFPLILVSFIKECKSGSSKYLVLTSFLLTMQFFAGAPEIVLMNVLTLFFICIFFNVFTDENNQLHITVLPRITTLLLVLLIFLLLSSIQLIPFYELKSQSIRHSGLAYFEATIWAFTWRDFIQFFLPDFFANLQNDIKYWSNQSWLKSIYLGIIPFILSTFYFVSKDRKRPIFIVLIIVSIVFALGGNTPIYKLLYKLPPFNSIRFPAKFLFLFFFAIAVTAGLGFDCLRKGIEKKSSTIAKLIKTIFYIGFIFALSWGFTNIFHKEIYHIFEVHGIKPDNYNSIDFNLHNIKRFFLFSAIFCVSFIFCLEIKKTKIALSAIIIFLSLDLFITNLGMFDYTRWSFYINRHKFIESINKEGDNRRYIATPATKKKFPKYPDDRAILNPYYAGLFGLYTIDGAEVLRTIPQDSLLNIIKNTDSLDYAKRYFNISGISFLITINDIKDKDFKLIDTIKIRETPVYLYEYLSQPGRFLFYRQASYADNDKTIMEKLQDKGIDLKDELILFSEDPDNEKGILHETKSNKKEKNDIKLVSYKPNKIILDYKTQDDCFLYVSDSYYPGWRAYIDGKETKIYRANLAFRAIKIPKGEHTVIFRYIPISFYAGLALTIIGIFLCIYLLKKDKTKKN